MHRGVAEMHREVAEMHREKERRFSGDRRGTRREIAGITFLSAALRFALSLPPYARSVPGMT
eukprot:2693013-Rhodomonas_salina.1